MELSVVNAVTWACKKLDPKGELYLCTSNCGKDAKDRYVSINVNRLDRAQQLILVYNEVSDAWNDYNEGNAEYAQGVFNNFKEDGLFWSDLGMHLSLFCN
jgi:hypothetical protein